MQRDLARDHPAHRVAEESEVVEPRRIGDRQRVGHEPGERIRRGIRRIVARAVTAMIEDHDRVVLRQRRDVIGEVLLRATEPVHQEKSGPVTDDLGFEPHPVVHRDPHPYMLTRIGCGAPGDGPGPPRACT